MPEVRFGHAALRIVRQWIRHFETRGAGSCCLRTPDKADRIVAWASHGDGVFVTTSSIEVLSWLVNMSGSSALKVAHGTTVFRKRCEEQSVSS